MAKDKTNMKKTVKKAALAKKAAKALKPARKAKPVAKSKAKATHQTAVKVKAKPLARKPVKPVVKAKAASHATPVKAAAPAKKPVVAAHKPVAVHKPVAAKPLHQPHAPQHAAARPVAAAPAKPVMPAPVAAKPATAAAPLAPRKLSFKVGEQIVYPAHGVGRITAIEEQEIAGARLELYIVDFEREKLRLKVPTNRAEQKGMRRLADRGLVEHAMKVIRGRARIKRTMWSRRAQEYDAKINSGDLIAVAEVVRDLYRSDRQPEQSYSERQLFEQALMRMARELAAVRKIDDDQSVKELSEFLAKNAKRVQAAEKPEEEPASTEEAA
jgi:CarD family transcriptional regulator